MGQPAVASAGTVPLTRFSGIDGLSDRFHADFSQLFPLVRWSDDFTLLGLQRRQLLVVAEDGLRGGQTTASFAIADELFDSAVLPEWFAAQRRRLRSSFALQWDAVEAIAVRPAQVSDLYGRQRKGATFTIRSADGARHQVTLPLVEAIFVLRAIDQLIGERLQVDEQIVSDLASRAERIAAKAEALSSANRAKAGTSPEPEPVKGLLLMLAGAVLVLGWPALVLLENWIPLLLAIFVGVPFGAGLLQVGRAMRVPRYEDVMARDSRRPIAYLRSFGSEDAVIPARVPGMWGRAMLRLWDRAWMVSLPGAAIAWLVRLLFVLAGRGSDRLEEHLARVLGRVGPMVAIGRPGEDLAALGAARAYLSDDDWQQFVIDMLRRSQLVLLQIESSEGTWWEFSQCVRTVPLHRIVLLLTARFGSQQRYDEMRILAQQTMGFSLPRNIGDAAFIYFDKDGTAHGAPMIWHPFWIAWARTSPVNLRKSLRPVLDRALRDTEERGG